MLLLLAVGVHPAVGLPVVSPPLIVLPQWFLPYWLMLDAAVHLFLSLQCWLLLAAAAAAVPLLLQCW